MQKNIQIDVEGLARSGLDKPIIKRAEEINKCYFNVHQELEVSS